MVRFDSISFLVGPRAAFTPLLVLFAITSEHRLKHTHLLTYNIIILVIIIIIITDTTSGREIHEAALDTCRQAAAKRPLHANAVWPASSDNNNNNNEDGQSSFGNVKTNHHSSSGGAIGPTARRNDHWPAPKQPTNRKHGQRRLAPSSS